MKPGELYKPVGSDCVLLCVADGVFTVEAGTCPFHADPATGRIHFDPTPPMHRAWHWSDLATPEQALENPFEDALQVATMVTESLEKGNFTIELNNTVYIYTPEYENNL